MSESAKCNHNSGDPVFPLEIFELIIDKIRHSWTSGSHATLCACSLVCKAFVPLCHRHLFSVIHLHRNRSEIKPSFQRLAEIFRYQPSMAKHVRKFCYGFDETEYETADNQNDDPFNSFLAFPYLQSLSIDSTLYGEESYPSCTNNKGIFPVRLLKAYLDLGNLANLELRGIADLPIFDILSLTKLTSLRVDACLIDPLAFQNNELQYNFGLQHFNGRQFEHSWFVILTRCCPSLQTIHAHNSGHSSPGSGHSRFRAKSIPFSQTLHTFTYDAEINLALLCWAAEALGANAFPGVKEFNIVSLGDLDLNRVGCCTINRLLQHLPRLERLLVTGKSHADVFSSLDLNEGVGTSEFLKHISIKWRDYHDPGETSVVNSLANYLEIMRGRNSIERIELEMRVKHSRRWQKMTFSAWEKLDQTLLEDRLAHFPSLQSVSIAVRPADKDDGLTAEDLMHLEAPWKTALMRLFATSEIVFEHTVQPLQLSRSVKWLRDFKRQMRALNLDN